MIKEERIRVGQIQDQFVRMTITGKIDDILKEKHPIELPNIFQECEAKKKRKVVLLEGAAGSGKSTLALHLAQQVSRGELFKEFSIAIFVSLRDPNIQQARSIADLLPRQDPEMVQQVARKINMTNGREVLFILDGSDELPSQFHKNSIFSQLIHPKVSQVNPRHMHMHECAVIITSRPIASGDLHPLVSSRVEILGFTPKTLKKYFTQCLEGNNEAVETLLKRIHENPALESSCYLHLDASIMLHLFKSGNNTLPPTQYGIFSEFILSCIFRNQNERSDGKNLSLESLQDLPDVVKAPFLLLCQLAYEGVMNDRVTFIDLDLPDDFDTLGLLLKVQRAWLEEGNHGHTISYTCRFKSFWLHFTWQHNYYLASKYQDFWNFSTVPVSVLCSYSIQPSRNYRFLVLVTSSTELPWNME